MAQMKKIDVKTLKTVKGGTFGGCYSPCAPCGGGHGGGKSKKC